MTLEEENKYLLAENDKLKIQIRSLKTQKQKQKHKIELMEKLNRKLFELFMKSQQTVRDYEYQNGVLFGEGSHDRDEVEQDE